MKRHPLFWVFVAGFAAVVGTGCSSSKTTDIDEIDDAVEVAEAGTDSAPEAGDSLSATPEENKETTASKEPEAPAGDSLAEAPTDDSAPKAIEDSAVSAPVVADTASTSGSGSSESLSSVSDSTMPQSTGEFENYSVKSGDTLMRIAFEVYGDLFQWKKIYEMNKDKVTDPNNLSKGVVLKVEKMSGSSSVASRGGDKVMIKQGDTLGTISDDIYGSPRKWRKLYEQNKDWIKDPNRIFAGFYLYYTMSPEEQQEAERLKQEKGTAVPPLAEKTPDSRHPAGGVAK